MNHYEVLGVSQTATDAEIKSAFRKKAKQYHPDVNQGDAASEAKFKQVNEAYEILKDSQKRAHYDYTLTPKPRGSSNGGKPFDWEEEYNRRRQYGQYSNNRGPYGGAEADIEELLREAMRRHQTQAQPKKNKDTNLTYTITFMESFEGKEVELRYTTGSGSSKTVKVSIPRSVEHGQKIRINGQGDDSIKDAPPGDLYVNIVVARDPRFVRTDWGVSTTIYIDFIDAILGCHKVVPCIDGTSINLRVVAGMVPGASLRVPEKGFYDNKGIRGPMMVEVVMEQPKLNEAQLEALTKIRDLK